MVDEETEAYNSWDEDEDEVETTVCSLKTGEKIKSSNNTEHEKPKKNVIHHSPECEEESIVIKPSCTCPSCKHWNESNDWTTTDYLEFEGYHKKTCIKEKIVQPLLRSEKRSGRTPKISTFSADNLTKIEKQAALKILVHGEIIPKPVTNFTDSYFTEEIQKTLAVLNYKYSLPIQAFAWPAIFRCLNIFMIGSKKSGKTMSYLPAVCTFSAIQEKKSEGYTKQKGPMVIIICPNSKHCEEIFDLTKKLFAHTPKPPKTAIITYPITHNLHTDILITIPESLIHCIQTRIFNLKRLRHLVLEESNCLLKLFESSVYKILSVVDEMLEHRVSRDKVQIILSSTNWSTDLEKLYKTMYVTPLICISDYLEAALYGGIKFAIKILQPFNKTAYLKAILQDKFNMHKTIIFCDNSEVDELNKCLSDENIETIALSASATKEEIEKSETEWLCTKSGKYKVLLCTDFIFETLLRVNDAMWLVNYSFPNTWTRFTKRFSALSTHYISPWKRTQEEMFSKCFLIIDDACEQQMPRILNLFKRLNELPDDFKQLQEEYRLRNENEKLNNNVNLCEKLKLFGKCFDQSCDRRHLIKQEIDISDNLPKRGKISFKILNMKDVTVYTVQLLQHTDLNCDNVTVSDVNLKKPLIYPSNYEKNKAENIKLGKFYAHCDYNFDGEEYTLCHILSIDDDKVEVKLITGFILQTFKTKLFELPLDIKIADIFLCNLVPPFRDESFSGKSFHIAHMSLQEKNYKNLILTGDIYLQLDNTFWLQNVVETSKVDGMDVIKFSLTKHLINLNVVEKNSCQISSLHKLCFKCGITLPNYVKKAARKSIKSCDVEPQNAFLNENVNEVNLISAVSPDEFYVRLLKFQPLLQNLENDIQREVATEVLDKNVDIEIGKYYLALDPQERMYCRAKLLNVEDNKGLCFYVDYGDEAVVDVKTLKILPLKFITKLPFQAIQCRLYGLCAALGSWDNEATDILYKYMFEPDSDIFRSLYVRDYAKDDGDLIRAKLKYSVLLKDGYGNNNTLINQLLLDCGLATSIFQKLDDFEIPQPQVVEDSESSESDKHVNTVDAEEDIEEINNEEFQIGEELEFEIFNPDEFLEMMGMPYLNHFKTRQLTYENQQTSVDHENIQNSGNGNEEGSGNKPSYLTPEVYWSQTENTIKMRIKLIGVPDYKMNVIQKRIFIFSTCLNHNNYQLKFTFHKPVEMRKHRALGQEVEIVLNKLENIEWMQLTGSNKRMRYIHYEVSDVKEQKRRFLQLDITDEETDDDEDEKPMIYEFSDMGSEFDEEINSSSSD